MKKAFIEKLVDWIGFIGSLLIAGVYLAWGLINLKKTGKSIAEIVGEAAMIFGLGQTISLLLRIQGIILGKNSEKYERTNILFGEAVIKCSPLIEYGDEFVIEENKDALKQVRIQLLARKGMKYEDHFDADGGFKDNYYVIPDGASKLIKKRIKDKNAKLQMAIDAEVTMLQFSDLTSSDTKPNDPNYLGRSESQFIMSNTLKGLFIGAASSILFSYYGYELIKDFTKEDLIYKAMQIAFIMSVGFIQLLFSYLNVLGPLRNRMIRQINKLEKFYNKYQHRPKLKLNLGFTDKPKEGSVEHGTDNNPGLPEGIAQKESVGRPGTASTSIERANDQPTGERAVAASVHPQ